ncbi:MAG: hypothetical protein Q8K75_09480 [Chlamydiales bacterium]|nr:hypothetical protein [Chlamydiales bacterium]
MDSMRVEDGHRYIFSATTTNKEKVVFKRTSEGVLYAARKTDDSTRVIIQGIPPEVKASDQNLIEFLGSSFLDLSGRFLNVNFSVLGGGKNKKNETIEGEQTVKKKHRRKRTRRVAASETTVTSEIKQEEAVKKREGLTLSGHVKKLQPGIEHIKKNLDPAIYHQTLLDELLEVDQTGSLAHSYKYMLKRLDAFSFGMKALSSGEVQRTDTLTDTLGNGLFSALSAVKSAGAAVGNAFAPGAGTIVGELAVAPALTAAQMAFHYKQTKKMERQVSSAEIYLPAGIGNIDMHNRFIALNLTYLLQTQLPLCSTKGMEAIVDRWLYLLFYYVVKMNDPEKEERDIVSLMNSVFKATQLSEYRIVNKFKKLIGTHAIETLDPLLSWTTEELFTQCGVAYPTIDGGVCYESCIVEKAGESTSITDARQYGYFFFRNEEEAIAYKIATSQRFSSPVEAKLYWVADRDPLGPIDGKGKLSSNHTRKVSRLSTTGPSDFSSGVMSFYSEILRELAEMNKIIADLGNRVSALEQQLTIVSLDRSRIDLTKK